jgi:RNA polymerase sigma factor (sigma-70 family)
MRLGLRAKTEIDGAGLSHGWLVIGPAVGGSVSALPRGGPSTDGPGDVTRMSDDTITELLERLSSGRVDPAWSEFLARYSPLILHVIRQHDADTGHSAECFVYVCGALSDDRCRRLLSFRPDGPARFKTWLMAVVSNLCVDWRRKEQGRLRPLRRISRLPELDQQIYRCIYLYGMSRRQCVETLAPRFPELTEAKASEINARLFALLTPKQRWQICARTPPLRPVFAAVGSGEDDPAWQVADPGPGPDDVTAEQQDQQRLRAALARLPAGQRLLLRLRYEQNLTLADVARLTNQPDPFRTNRQIQSALKALAELMGDPQVRPGRKTR